MKRAHSAHFNFSSSPVLALLLATLSGGVLAQSSAVRSDVTEKTPVNLDFEQGEVGQVPTGWNSSTAKYGYTVRLSEENPKAGRRCVLLHGQPDAKAAEQGFGNVMQAVDATPYRGRRLRFKGAVRMEAADSRVRTQLWLRVDRGSQQIGFSDNMGDAPIFSTAWQHYEIIADVDEDATVINFGMMLDGNGKAWLDDVSIEDLGKLIVLAEPPRALTQRGLENLIAFTRLLGYVRHFHPSDGAAATNCEDGLAGRSQTGAGIGGYRPG